MTNSLYYSLTDGSNALPENWNGDEYSNDSYQSRYVTRWERLDTAKVYTKENNYYGNAQRFYAEYSVHMYGWYLTSWAYQKENFGEISEWANHLKTAEVYPNKWDNRWYVNILTVLFMGFGM